MNSRYSLFFCFVLLGCGESVLRKPSDASSPASAELEVGSQSSSLGASAPQTVVDGTLQVGCHGTLAPPGARLDCWLSSLLPDGTIRFDAKNVKWSTDDIRIVRIEPSTSDSQAAVLLGSPGLAHLNAELSGRTSNTIVGAPDLVIQELIVGEGPTFELIAGEKRKITIIGRYESRTGQTFVADLTRVVAWEASSPTIVRHSENVPGDIIGLTPGRSTMTISYLGKTSTIDFVVRDGALPNLYIDSDSDKLMLGVDHQFVLISRATIDPSSIQRMIASPKWSSSDPHVVTIDPVTGLASPRSVGVANIVAEFGGVTATKKISVSEVAGSLSVSPSSLRLRVGELTTIDLLLTADHEQAGQSIHFEKLTLRKGILGTATVYQRGGRIFVRGHAPGVAEFDLAVNQRVVNLRVEVVAPAAVQVQIDPPQSTLRVGDTIKLMLVAYDGLQKAELISPKVEWFSSHPQLLKVAQVAGTDSVTATALSPGKVWLGVEGVFAAAAQIEVLPAVATSTTLPNASSETTLTTMPAASVTSSTTLTTVASGGSPTTTPPSTTISPSSSTTTTTTIPNSGTGGAAAGATAVFYSLHTKITGTNLGIGTYFKQRVNDLDCYSDPYVQYVGGSSVTDFRYCMAVGNYGSHTTPTYVGNLTRSENNGAQWGLPESAGSVNLNGVSMVGRSEAWVVGDQGTLARYANGTLGTTTNLTGNDLRSIDMFRETSGVAVGDGGFIAYFKNGSWLAASSVSFDLKSVSMPGPTVAFAVGDGGRILKSTDSGETWTDISPSGLSTNLTSVSCFSRSYCWVVGENGIALRTGDGGLSWTPLAMQTTPTMFDVSALAFDRLRIVGDGFDSTFDTQIASDVRHVVTVLGPRDPDRDVSTYNCGAAGRPFTRWRDNGMVIRYPIFNGSNHSGGHWSAQLADSAVGLTGGGYLDAPVLYYQDPGSPGLLDYNTVYCITNAEVGNL